MLNTKSFLAVDFGAGSLKLAEFEINEAGGLRLKQYGIKPLGAEGAQETAREATILKALQELMAEKGIKAKQRQRLRARASTSSPNLSSCRPVDASKVTQIIQYEAQQNVPFPLEEVVWDYQILGSTAGGELEVLLVAIKADIVEGLFRVTETPGLQLQLADVSPAALCNAFRYNYGDLEDCTMLLDIGAKTSNLLFFEKGKVFSRSINLGANSITQDFANESKMKFDAAEKLKIEEGFVSLGGAYEEPENPHQAAISKIARQFMTRLHIQVNQTMQFYRGQQGGSAPAAAVPVRRRLDHAVHRAVLCRKAQRPRRVLQPAPQYSDRSGDQSGRTGPGRPFARRSRRFGAAQPRPLPGRAQPDAGEHAQVAELQPEEAVLHRDRVQPGGRHRGHWVPLRQAGRRQDRRARRLNEEVEPEESKKSEQFTKAFDDLKNTKRRCRPDGHLVERALLLGRRPVRAAPDDDPSGARPAKPSCGPTPAFGSSSCMTAEPRTEGEPGGPGRGGSRGHRHSRRSCPACGRREAGGNARPHPLGATRRPPSRRPFRSMPPAPAGRKTKAGPNEVASFTLTFRAMSLNSVSADANKEIAYAMLNEMQIQLRLRSRPDRSRRRGPACEEPPGTFTFGIIVSLKHPFKL